MGDFRHARGRGGTWMRAGALLSAAVLALLSIGGEAGAIDPVNPAGGEAIDSADGLSQNRDAIIEAPQDFVSSAGGVFEFDDTSVVPPRNGNTIHDRQPMAVVVRVPAGLDLGSVSMNVATGAGEVYRPDVLVTPLDDGLMRVQSTPVPLAVDTRYIAELSLSDTLGNIDSLRWTFRRMDFRVEPTTASVPVAEGAWKGDSQEWVFLPKVRVRGFSVHSSPTEHSGWGPVGQVVPLASAEVAYRLPGADEEIVVRPYAEDYDATVYKPYGKALAEGTTLVDLHGREVWLPPLAMKLPAEAVDPVVRMGSVETVPYIPAESCAVATAEMPACTSDPLRFFLPEDFADALYHLPGELGVATERGESAPTDVTEPLGELPLYLAELIDLVPNGAADAVSTPYWRPLVANSRAFATGAWHTPQAWIDYWEWVLFENWQGWRCVEDPNSCMPTYASGVGYQTTLPVEVPEMFGALCGAGYPCTAAAASDAETEQLRRECLQINGEEKRHPGKNCRQFNVIHHMRVAYPISIGYPSKFDFQVVVRSQLGYMNWYTANPYDQLGIVWDDGEGWQIRRDQYDNFKSSRYETYYCDGREVNQPLAQQQHLFRMDIVSGYELQISVGPYGVAHPDAAQYRTSSALGMPSANAWCMGFYPYPGAVSPVNRPAFGRMTTMMVSAWGSTYANQFAGTAVGSVGHVWRTYQFRWKPTLRPFSSARGAFFTLFGFEPYEEDKSSEIHWDLYYEYGY